MTSVTMNIEEIRRKNIEDNKRILKEIGLLNPFNFKPKVTLKKTGIKRKAEGQLARKPKRPALEEVIDHENHGSVRGSRRRSARLLGVEASELDEQDFIDEEEEKKGPQKKIRPGNSYGRIEGIEVGASWNTRMECSEDLIHRVTVAGIHGGPEGAYSIALSGGYDDNIDMGDCFTYTGEGGRDLKGTANKPKNLRTAPQSKDQTLSKGNKALQTSVETGNPVRVIRGYKLTSAFAPEEGYRYDGLYTVQKAWYTMGQSGFMVWKFALKRMENQSQPPWTIAEEFRNGKDDTGSTQKEAVETKSQKEDDKAISAEVEEAKSEQQMENDNSEEIEDDKAVSAKLEDANSEEMEDDKAIPAKAEDIKSEEKEDDEAITAKVEEANCEEIKDDNPEQIEGDKLEQIEDDKAISAKVEDTKSDQSDKIEEISSEQTKEVEEISSRKLEEMEEPQENLVDTFSNKKDTAGENTVKVPLMQDNNNDIAETNQN